MSRIGDLGPKMANLPQLISEYELAFSRIESDLTIRGKTLETALKEQATFPIYYDQRRVELKLSSSFSTRRCHAFVAS